MTRPPEVSSISLSYDAVSPTTSYNNINTSHNTTNELLINSTVSYSFINESLNHTTAKGPIDYSRNTDVYLWIYVSPVILFLGLCGNTLVLLVINRKNLRGTTTCIYLTMLAIFDTLALISGIIPEWTSACGFSTFSSLHSFTCQLEKFVFYTTSDTAIWILVLFTMDRFVAVCFPLYKRSVCVPKRSKIACLVVFALAIVKNFHVFWTRGLVAGLCTKNPQFSYFESAVRPWIAFALVSVLSFIILVICNSMIILTLARVTKTENKKNNIQIQMRAAKSQRDDVAIKTDQSSGPSQNVTKAQRSAQSSKPTSLETSTEKSRVSKAPPVKQSYRQTTMMCLSASITFLIFVFPSIVMLIGKPYWAKDEEGNSNAMYDVCKAINNQLACLNHAINFFLYCITGRKFRSELVSMFREWCACCPCSKKVLQRKSFFDPSRSSGLSFKQSIVGIWRSRLSTFFTQTGTTSTTAVESSTCYNGDKVCETPNAANRLGDDLGGTSEA